ncbi:serine/threonine protein kinase [Micromonospora sp. BL1]|uniref:class III lanthionine synthetase LanKC n=1 Tax=unclassified Micromonospora TaxID=2617518 RepID=UPI000EF5EEFE|nr:class III lanthionine synthetase LanKC [Micromonospora sp. BL1]NED50679.1 protein kinase/lanthionine synthetase C family protein [Micromonospora aurantiaca]RLQ03542.1 serine/threonine protein kinase [Micromonospora sp. BL1]
MFELKQVYCFADQVFFDDVSNWRDGPGFDTAAGFRVDARQVPDGWTRVERGIWTVLRPDRTEGPEQGWKIHAAATPQNADEVISRVWDYCTARDIRFKYLRNPNVLVALNAKYAPRSASGKAVTIYPVDEAALRLILEELDPLLAGLSGPYILSDLRYGAGPLYVRYGGFRRMECLDDAGQLVPAIRDPDGTLVPDVRRPVFAPPSWATLPEFLRPHLAARTAGSGGELPYRVERTLHFSNAGGVYQAVRTTDGKRVVLKEARPYAGFDEHRQDSVARMRRERWALEKLAGVPGVPEVYGSVEAGGHHFLVQEFLDAQSLHVWLGCNHPWVVLADPTPDDFAAFTKRALAIAERIERLLAAVHERGVVFGDLHLGNVMVHADDSVSLIDFELAFDAAQADWRPGLGATGFTSRDRSGADLDRYALAAVRLGMFMTLNRVVALDPDKVVQYAHEAERHFPLPAGWADEIIAELRPPGAKVHKPCGDEPLAVDLDASLPDWSAATRSMARAIMASATPDREDRLFPGDTRQFSVGGLNLAYGAAGVLWALSATGQGRWPGHEEWLLSAVRRQTGMRPGFYDGAAGVAYALHHLGHEEAAYDLVARWGGGPGAVLPMDLFSGYAGVGLNLLHLGRAAGESSWRTDALAIGDRLADAVRSGNPNLPRGERRPPRTPVEAGLMRGWSGVALFLLRLYEETGDRGLLDAAVTAVHRDLDRCTTTADGSLQVEEVGVRTLGYLEVGSAGIALVADELLEHRDDERVRASLPALLSACARGFVIQVDLFRGRIGLGATLARIAGRHGITDVESAVDRHLRRLSWHAIAYRGELAFPGDLDFRLSMDLATGTAGVLLGTAAATGRTPDFLPFLSPRP